MVCVKTRYVSNQKNRHLGQVVADIDSMIYMKQDLDTVASAERGGAVARRPVGKGGIGRKLTFGDDARVGFVDLTSVGETLPA